MSKGGRESWEEDAPRRWRAVGWLVGLANGVMCRTSWDSCGLSMDVGKGRL